ncbi:HAD-IC family P-type ATPase, partial [Candidatus Uhrbacteria bacterium]|nr:HAD-IC family P-type ATPase [Candidatus Uhrbacteria bacterium]
MLTYSRAAVMEKTELLGELSTSPIGLSPETAAGRLIEVGPNAVNSHETPAWRILVRQLSSAFVYLLLVAAGLAFVLGERIDAAMILLFVAINTTLGFAQEYRAELAAKILKRYWRHTARAVRDGATSEVDARDLVPGDVIRLRAGDKIPADVRLIDAHGLAIDESSLTGESASVAKHFSAMTDEPREFGDAGNIGFAGTDVLTGEATGVVIATGRDSALGGITALTLETHAPSAFETNIAKFSVFILKLTLVTLAFVLALNLALKGLGRAEELLLFSIALTVGVIPEALPLVTTIALSTGALRMTRRHAVVRRLSAIEDLGSIDILCTDKTGTITQNKLTVSDIRAADKDACLRYALLGSCYVGADAPPHNEFDEALWKKASKIARDQAKHATKLGELPFDPDRRRNSMLVDSARERTLVVRGSSDEILKLCRAVEDPIGVGRYLERQGLAGNRVITIAVKHGLAAHADLAAEERDLELVGFISFKDPLKPDAKAAAEKARRLGVQIKILTGDSKPVAAAVAREIGIISDALEVVSGAEFDAMPLDEKHRAIDRYHVFARVNPRQKFEVLALLQEKNTVGFLGEGFNDAPGLKMANVAIAVAGASDIAREASDVILLDKSLMVIFDGVEEGRRVFTNIVKYLKATLASNFGNFYAVAAASLFIDFLPMLPLQILLVNLLSDFPMMSIATDTVSPEDLRQ